MVGPPGAGKSMLAARLPSILPPLDPRELLEVSMIAVDRRRTLRRASFPTARPFRAPHHSASMAAMVGGGLRIRPGEASLAHNGVLFLDELPEFAPAVLDSLRQPLEAGEVAIARANDHVTYPARFQLVAAMNPCRCGLAGEPGHSCAARPKLRRRLSGAALRPVPRPHRHPPRSAGRQRVGSHCAGRRGSQRHRRRARRRGAGDPARALSRPRPPEISTNARCSTSQIEAAAHADGPALALLRDAAESMRLSARGYHRVLKVARTLADLDGEGAIGRIHLAEALSFRIAGAQTALAA